MQVVVVIFASLAPAFGFTIPPIASHTTATASYAMPAAITMQEFAEPPTFTEKAVVRRGTLVGPNVHFAVRSTSERVPFYRAHAAYFITLDAHLSFRIL